MKTPGAARSTVLAPKLEKPAMLSLRSLAATEMMLSRGSDAGYRARVG